MKDQAHKPRSYLFVPGDSAHKMDKGAASCADAIILDLEDSVAPTRKVEALRITAEFLADHDPADAGPALWVRVNASRPDTALAELATLPLRKIAGIIHPKLGSHAQLERIGYWLDALESRDEIENAPTGIIGIITETASSVVGEQACTLARGHPRLRGYSWGTEDLSAVLGRSPLAGLTNANSALAQSMQMHCLMIAAAAGVEAIDSISANFRDLDSLAAECVYARELGYTSKMTIHPAQLDTVHENLAPSADAIKWAQQVQSVVDANPDAASFQLDGRMVDQPHFNVAARILERARKTD